MQARTYLGQEHTFKTRFISSFCCEWSVETADHHRHIKDSQQPLSCGVKAHDSNVLLIMKASCRWFICQRSFFLQRSSGGIVTQIGKKLNFTYTFTLEAPLQLSINFYTECPTLLTHYKRDLLMIRTGGMITAIKNYSFVHLATVLRQKKLTYPLTS